MISIQEVADEFVKDCRFVDGEQVFISNVGNDSFTVNMGQDSIIVMINKSLSNINSVKELKSRKVSPDEYDKSRGFPPGTSKKFKAMLGERVNVNSSIKGPEVFNVDNDTRGDTTWEKATKWVRIDLLDSNYGYGKTHHPEYLRQQEALKKARDGEYERPTGRAYVGKRAEEIMGAWTNGFRGLITLAIIGLFIVGISNLFFGSDVAKGMAIGYGIFVGCTMLSAMYVGGFDGEELSLTFMLLSLPFLPIIIPFIKHSDNKRVARGERLYWPTGSDGLVRGYGVAITPIELDVIKRGLLAPNGLVRGIGFVNGYNQNNDTALSIMAKDHKPAIIVPSAEAAMPYWEGRDTPRGDRSWNNTINSLTYAAANGGKFPPKSHTKTTKNPNGTNNVNGQSSPKKNIPWKRRPKLDPDVNF